MRFFRVWRSYVCADHQLTFPTAPNSKEGHWLHQWRIDRLNSRWVKEHFLSVMSKAKLSLCVAIFVCAQVPMLGHATEMEDFKRRASMAELQTGANEVLNALMGEICTPLWTEPSKVNDWLACNTGVKGTWSEINMAMLTGTSNQVLPPPKARGAFTDRLLFTYCKDTLDKYPRSYGACRKGVEGVIAAQAKAEAKASKKSR